MEATVERFRFFSEVITADAQAIVDELLPSLHARERDVISAALSASEQREFLTLVAKLQQSAVEARSAPAPRGAARRRLNRADPH